MEVAHRCRALMTMTNGTGAPCSERRKMQVTPSRTVQRMDNDARTGNSSLAVRRMHDDSQQPLTTDCRTTRRSALAAGTLLLLLCVPALGVAAQRSEEHTSELQSLMRISYAVFCLKKKKSYQTNAQ